MIKVRIVPLVALASTTAACAVEQNAPDDVVSGDDALTVANPGTGVFALTWTYGTPTGYSFALTQSSTDEYLRAREKMSFTVPAFFLWTRLYPNDAMPDDLTRLSQLSAKLTAVYVKEGATLASSTVKTNGWTGGDAWNLVASTGTFTIHRKAQGVRFELEITDAAPNGKTLTLGQDQFLELPVFGASLPAKTLLFDNDGSKLRSRVIEGGLPVRGAELALGYTDWRADTLVDKSSIDRVIGKQTSYSRFGAIEIPIYGDLEYEIAYGAAFDDVWQAEQALTANGKSRLVPPNGRTAWEGTTAVPRTAQALQIYFHVKAFLKVDYSKYTNITWRRYADGDRILVREKWDNENGAAGDNWDFATEKR